MLKRPEFKIGSDTQAIMDLMAERAHEANPLLTNREIEKITGKSMDASRGAVYTARKHFRADHGRWWANVPGVGYRILPDEELPHCGKGNRIKARNLHRESLKILAIADASKQSAEARTSTILERSIAELGMAATAPRAISKAQQMVMRSHNELTSEQQIEAINDALKPK